MLHDGDWFDCVVWSGLWNEEDGFFYDHIRVNGKKTMPLKILSMVGLVPLFSCMVLKQDVLRRHPGFYKRTRWFLNNRKDLSHHVSVKGVMMKMCLCMCTLMIKMYVLYISFLSDLVLLICGFLVDISHVWKDCVILRSFRYFSCLILIFSPMQIPSSLFYVWYRHVVLM